MHLGDSSRAGGLIGDISISTQVSNISLKNSKVQGFNYVGGIIGYINYTQHDTVPFPINLSVENSEIIGNSCVGGIVGNGNIRSSISKNNKITGKYLVGGVIGNMNLNTYTTQNLLSKNNIITYTGANNSGYAYVGGISGMASWQIRNSIVENCIIKNSGTSSGKAVGGIVGTTAIGLRLRLRCRKYYY